jgi:hypothetical protein
VAITTRDGSNDAHAAEGNVVAIQLMPTARWSKRGVEKETNFPRELFVSA